MHSPQRLVRIASAFPGLFIVAVLALEAINFGVFWDGIRGSRGIGDRLVSIFHFVLFTVEYIMVVWSYLACVFTEPGVPTEDLVEAFEGAYGEVYVTKCTTCDSLRLPRTHHCSVCRMCIVNMDHHCPWMCNCIGYRNKKFFVLFLAYAFVGCSHICLRNAPLVLEYALSGQRASRVYGRRKLISHISAVLTAFSFAVTVLLFGGFHLYLVLRNRTTIELNFSRGSPFDVGVARNWRAVMDDSPWLWFLPVHDRRFCQRWVLNPHMMRRFQEMLALQGFVVDDDEEMPSGRKKRGGGRAAHSHVQSRSRPGGTGLEFAMNEDGSSDSSIDGPLGRGEDAGETEEYEVEEESSYAYSDSEKEEQEQEEEEEEEARNVEKSGDVSEKEEMVVFVKKSHRILKKLEKQKKQLDLISRKDQRLVATMQHKEEIRVDTKEARGWV